jgi:hypothetical protein
VNPQRRERSARELSAIEAELERVGRALAGKGGLRAQRAALDRELEGLAVEALRVRNRAASVRAKLRVVGSQVAQVERRASSLERARERAKARLYRV